MNMTTSVTLPFVLGGHVFHAIDECREAFLIPRQYVAHMLSSVDYPGCRYLTDEELASYMQTLATNSR